MKVPAMLRNFGKRLVGPVWRRVWSRIENRLKPIEADIAVYSDRLAAAESELRHLPVLEQRLHAAEHEAGQVPVLDRHLAILDGRMQVAELETNHVPVLDRRLAMLDAR